MMNQDCREYVLDLLQSYRQREREIAVRRFELTHYPAISDREMIEALNYAHGDGEPRSVGHISNKTMYIALNYRERAKMANAGARSELVQELCELEQKQARLTYFVSLLDARQAMVLRLAYFEGHSNEKIARELSLASRTIRDIKSAAVEELTAMYAVTYAPN